MTREEILKEIEQTLGLVPSFLKNIPDEYLEDEWGMLKRIELSETHIPGKYKELMGLALSAATKCIYCILFHTEMAKCQGATDEEIEEAVHFAKHTAGWSAYVNGIQLDLDEFRRETLQIVEHMKAQAHKRAA